VAIREITVEFPARPTTFPLLWNFQTVSRSHKTSWSR